MHPACFGFLVIVEVNKCFIIFLHSTDLGHQTAQRIVHASDPLQSMQEINQNFPSVVSSLSRMKVCHCLLML